MKSLLIQIAAVLPLLGITVWTWIAPSRPAGSKATHQAYFDGEDAQQKCQDTERMLEKELPIARQLLGADPLDAKPLSSADSDAELQQLVADWKQADSLREMAAEVCEQQARIARQIEPLESKLAKTEAEMKDWRDFITTRRSAFSGKVAGAEELFALIQEHCHRLAAHQERLRKQEAIAAALTNAADCLDYGAIKHEVSDANRKKLDECLAILQEEPLRSARDPESRDKIDLLQRRVRYREDWYQVFTGARRPAREQLVRVREFLEKYPRAPSPAEEQAQHQARKQLAALKMDRQIAALGGSANLDQLLSRSEAIFRQQPSDDQKQSALASVRDWLTIKGLPRIEQPRELDELGELREAILKARGRKIGVFEVHNDKSPWLYWSHESGRQRTAAGESQFPRDQMVVEPATPYYVKFAKDYGSERKQLLAVDATRDEWSLVAGRLEEMQNDLSKYRREWDTADRKCHWDDLCRQWTLAPALLTARQMLEHWDRYHSLFRMEDGN